MTGGAGAGRAVTARVGTARAVAGLVARGGRRAWAWAAGAWDPTTSPATSVQGLHDACGALARAWSLLHPAL